MNRMALIKLKTIKTESKLNTQHATHHRITLNMCTSSEKKTNH